MDERLRFVARLLEGEAMTFAELIDLYLVEGTGHKKASTPRASGAASANVVMLPSRRSDATR